MRPRDGRTLEGVRVDPKDVATLSRYAWAKRGEDDVVYARDETGRRVGLARMILELAQGDSRVVKHRNGDHRDCRKSNLYLVSSEEARQDTSSRRGSSSRFRGVSWNRRRQEWQAYYRSGPKRKHIGWFKDELRAAIAVDEYRHQVAPHAKPDPALLGVAL